VRAFLIASREGSFSSSDHQGFAIQPGGTGLRHLKSLLTEEAIDGTNSSVFRQQHKAKSATSSRAERERLRAEKGGAQKIS